MSGEEFLHLHRLVDAHSTPQAITFRARIILRCIHGDKPTNDRVAADLGCDADTVSKWRRRFHWQRLDGLQDLPRSGRPRTFSPWRPPQGCVPGHRPPAEQGLPTTHWSLDDLAYRILQDAHYADMSRSTIQRILTDAELRPHKSRYWLSSHDPDFETKILDLCRLYLDAPVLYQRGELVIGVDEKTGIQALQRARPTTLGKPGQDERRDYEYLRHGTRCLIGSRVVATGQVIGSVTANRKTWDFVPHIRDVAERFPPTTKFQWVMDNLNTHWTFELCQYLGRLSDAWVDRPSLRTGAA